MQLSAVDSNLLVMLHPLLEARSVNKAAKRLGLSASATSHALARLRVLLGDELLVRAGRGLVLTPRGAELAPLVAQAVGALEKVLAPNQDFRPEELNRTFHLTYADYLDRVLLPPLDQALRVQAPRVNLHTHTAHLEVVEALRNGILDFAVVASHPLPPDMHTRPLLHDRFVSMVRVGHPCLDQRMTLKRFADLQHIMVAPSGTAGGVVDTLLQSKGLKRRVARTLGTFLSAPRLVASSDYVLTLPMSVARVTAEEVDFEILEMPQSPPGYTLHLVWHERMHHDPAHRWFRELVAIQMKGFDESMNSDS